MSEMSRQDRRRTPRRAARPRRYLAIVRKSPESDYGVDFPDLPGCISAGSTLDEAREMARESLALHIQGMLEDGDILPEPTYLLPATLDEVVAALVVEVEMDG